MTTYDNYTSPFSWRYAGNEMRSLWSEKTKRLFWRKTWLALAKAQVKFGIVSLEQTADIESHVSDVDIPRALEIESQIHHDLMAELLGDYQKTLISVLLIQHSIMHDESVLRNGVAH